MNDKVQELYEKRLAKLPQWAQRRISMLEDSLAHAKTQLAGDEITNIIVDPYINSQHIDDAETIRFVIEHEDWKGEQKARRYIDVRISRNDRRDIEITGQPGLTVYPRGGNSIIVRCDRKGEQA